AFGLFATSLALVLIPVAWWQADPQGLRIAEADFARGESSKALRKALKHLNSHRLGVGRASLIAAKSLSRLDQPDRAESYYQRAGSLSLEDRHIRAYAIVRANQRTRAIATYREILVDFPNDVLALRRLAGVHMSNTEYIEAMEIAERLMKLPDGRTIGHTLSGLIYHRTGYTDQSVAQFQRVLELDPLLKAMPLDPSWQFWAYLAEDLLSLGRSSEARIYLEDALESLPDARLAGLLGRAYHQEGDLAAAERTWRTAKEWDPELAGPWLELGKLALNQDRPAEALELLEHAEAL
ncbi:tetratricopeptide repeat protein, partial [Singulisphaera rosea]